MEEPEVTAEAVWARVRSTLPNSAAADQHQTLYFDNIPDLDDAAEQLWGLIQVLPTRTNGELELFYHVMSHPRNDDVFKRMHQLHPDYKLPGHSDPTLAGRGYVSYDLYAFSDDPESTEIWLLPYREGMRCFKMSREPANEQLSWLQILQMAGSQRHPNCQK
ncbi:hypothetical protein NpNSSI1_00005159 [Neofusicoccum parvum]|nr:hypothetical protein NpNSSI1_00005159 [Neofusicoccum parvum]